VARRQLRDPAADHYDLHELGDVWVRLQWPLDSKEGIANAAAPSSRSNPLHADRRAAGTRAYMTFLAWQTPRHTF